MQCAIVEVSSVEDATGYPCGNDAAQRCCDCDAHVCEAIRQPTIRRSRPLSLAGYGSRPDLSPLRVFCQSISQGSRPIETQKSRR